MRYLSVCSGIEAATVAWHPLGFQPVGFAEVEAFPSAVLAHHYPDIPNLGDLNAFREWPHLTPDVLVGGTPCQSFSVAGLRQGLADPRGNLALTYLAVAERYRPRWVVWENVPGVLSSNGGRDFGSSLGALAELGYGWAYRVLDAQYFGVPQRRRRVFVVGCAGNWRRAAAVLFERESLRGPKRQRTLGGSRRNLTSSERGGYIDMVRTVFGQHVVSEVMKKREDFFNGYSEILVRCRPSQFARYVVLREALGYQNDMASMKMRIVVPEPQKQYVDASKAGFRPNLEHYLEVNKDRAHTCGCGCDETCGECDGV